ncbi:MAG: hypothetical protein H6696_14265 [Deferribacteres bacterium]|nr:hypothetical protein [candidate division KSB1 bacterium]MCB9503093.1 hypothetical protein [Deferribacteres bacterium]
MLANLKRIFEEKLDAHFQQMRMALWLYLYLNVHANKNTGKLVVAADVIAEKFNVAEQVIRNWIAVLKRHQYISVKKQGKELILKISGWMKERESTESNIPENKTTSKNQRSKKLETELTKLPLPELSGKIVELFKAPDQQKIIESLCQSYPTDVIIQAVVETQKVPDSKIRKSRTAFFAFLVRQYAEEKSQTQKTPGN